MQFPQQVQDAASRWRNELEVLNAKRAQIASELEVLTNQRGQLADQIARTEEGMRNAPRARLTELDVRITRLDQEAQRTSSRISELLATAPLQEQVPAPVAPAHAPGVPPIIEVQSPPHFVEVPPDGWVPRSAIGKALVFEAAGFILLTALLCRWTWVRARARFLARPPVENTQLQQAVDAIAIEVERISEGQRFVTALLNQRHVDQKEPRSGMISPSAPRPKVITPV